MTNKMKKILLFIFPFFLHYHSKAQELYVGTNYEVIEEGTTFKTPGHGHDGKEFIWRVSKFEAENFLIQYLVSFENLYWTITIKYVPIGDNKTSATINYTFIGLNELGKPTEHVFFAKVI
jgi:hypothetical protein